MPGSAEEAGCRAAAIATVVATCLYCLGCATAPDSMIYVPKDMLPESRFAGSERPPAALSGESITVAPVTGVGASNLRVLSGSMGVPGTAEIWGQTFRKALSEALAGSHLFGGAASAETARYRLQADILQQEVAGYGALFRVRYSIHDRKVDREAWSQEIATDYRYPGGPITFAAPYNPQLRALMKASGQNIGALLGCLEKAHDAFQDPGPQGVPGPPE